MAAAAALTVVKVKMKEVMETMQMPVTGPADTYWDNLDDDLVGEV